MHTDTRAAVSAPLALSDTQLYAHYKATAPGLDLRFLMQGARLSPALHARAGELLTATHDDGRLQRGMTRAVFYRTLRILQDNWRRETAAQDHAERVAAQQEREAA
jgi:hypothetical protein